MNTRRRQRTTDLTFGTWNVQTMLQPGKMMEIANDGLVTQKECNTPQFQKKKDVVRKAVCNRTKRMTKNEMAG